SDTAPSLSQRFGIRGIPTLLLLDHGKEVARIVGAHPAPTLNEWVDGQLGKTSASAT
ncbi:MAG: thioredoxin family protein, partial [Chloroflexi bacterium]